MGQAELPRDPAAEQECDRRLNARGIQTFALLNPGAGWGAKQWPAERYAQVATQLAEDGLKSLINFGPGEEDLAGAVEAASNGAAQTLTGSLTELIALTRRARLFIGGDTGPMHLAAALGVPVVAIFGPTDPARNGPFGTRSIVLRSALSSTSYHHTSRADQGLLEISSAQVLAAARQLLEEHDG
jgi:heptosyltransferase I